MLPNRLLNLTQTMAPVELPKELRAERAAACAVRLGRASRRFARGAHLPGSWCYSGRHRSLHSGQTQQIAGSHGELELQVDAPQSAKHGLSNPADGLAPTEVLLDPFADDLADAVTRMTGGAPVDSATATPRVVGSDVGRDLALSTPGHEIGGIVGLVSADAAAAGRGRHRVEHGQGRLTFAETIRRGNDGADDQATTVLHQRVALIAENRCRLVALAIVPGIGISRAGVGIVGPRLTFPVRLRIAPTTARPLIVAAVLRSKALLARPRLNQRAVDRGVFLRQQATAIGQAQHLGKEAFHYPMHQQPVAILRERRVIPNRIIE